MVRVGVVVPTIFSRPDYLPLALKSIRLAGDTIILLSSPSPNEEQKSLISDLTSRGLIDLHVIEPEGVPLASKINHAFSSLPEECQLISWLGDDDLLEPKSLDYAKNILGEKVEVVGVFGGCNYIDKNGKRLITNKSGQWAAAILGFGPDLIPQPGSVWRRLEFEKLGGLSSQYELAFDFDLLLRLRSQGKLQYVPKVLASFRWHPDSLSVKRRWKSVFEASKVRRAHYQGVWQIIWPIWEPLVILSTWFAGKLLSIRFRKTAG